MSLRVGAIIEWRDPRGVAMPHRWRVIAAYVGSIEQENLVELQCVSHAPGVFTVGNVPGFGVYGVVAETMLVPECLLRTPTVSVFE